MILQGLFSGPDLIVPEWGLHQFLNFPWQIFVIFNHAAQVVQAGTFYHQLIDQAMPSRKQGVE